MSAASSSELDKRSAAHAVDPVDEPSAEWGWHGTFPRATRVAGWISAAILLLMLIGNHQGHIEDVWLVAIALCIIAGLIYDQIKRRTAWRRR